MSKKPELFRHAAGVVPKGKMRREQENTPEHQNIKSLLTKVERLLSEGKNSREQKTILLLLVKLLKRVDLLVTAYNLKIHSYAEHD